MGMNTAIKEMLIENTVKPISFAPSRAVDRCHPMFQVPRNVFHNDDSVVNDEAARDRKSHQRQVVERVAAQIHHAAGTDE